MQYWVQSQKWENDLNVFPRQTIQYPSNPSLCPNRSCRRSWRLTVLWRPTRPLELRPNKAVVFITGAWNAKVRSQEIPGVTGKYSSWTTKWSRAKANRVLPKECTGHSKHPLSTTQEKTLYMDITRWSILKSDWLYSLQSKMEKLYIVSKNKTGSWLWLRSWNPHSQIQAAIEESGENH